MISKQALHSDFPLSTHAFVSETWAKPTTEPLLTISLEPDRGRSENSDGQPQN